MKKVILSFLVLFSFSALADQCALLDKSQAEEAAELINQSKVVHEFCEPCGDTMPIPIGVQKIEVQEYQMPHSVGDYEVVYTDFFNQKYPMDIAYIYVDGLNLSKLVNCNSEGVSEEIQY